MCNKCEKPEMTGVHEGHLLILQKEAPQVSGITRDVHEALTENLNPHLPALTAFVAMAEALSNKDFGVLSDQKLVRLPLSVIGTDKVRYRTPIIDLLHESILSLRMSDLTIEAIRNVLRPHGLCVLFLCSCGVVMGRCEDVHKYYGSDLHKRMDRLRSAIDAEANPVVCVESFEDITVPTMDLHSNGSEERLFTRIEELTQEAAQVGHQNYKWIDTELNNFVSIANPASRAA